MSHKTGRLVTVAMIGLAVWSVGCSREEQPAAPPPAEPIAFEAVKPLLAKHCVACHGNDTAQENINFETMTPAALQANSALQQSMLFMLRSKQMPPNNATDLKDQERQTLIDWLRQMMS
jgi:uncharacterized membrane protein